MNLLLISTLPGADGRLKIRGRQAKHIREIIKKEVGESLRIGIDDSWVGSCIICESQEERNDDEPGTKRIKMDPEIALQLMHTCSIPGYIPPVRRCNVDLLMALPRPKVFDKVLQTCAMMGVGRLIFCSSSKVETSYFSSPYLQPLGITESLRLGLEQASTDPFYPQVIIFASWRRAITQMQENYKLPTHRCIILHPGEHAVSLTNIKNKIDNKEGPVLLAVGPEGGFVDDEVQELRNMGFQQAHLGSRILKVEAAVISAISQLDEGINPRQDIFPVTGVNCWCKLSEIPTKTIQLPIRNKFLAAK